jgi:PAS domain-containing protein
LPTNDIEILKKALERERKARQLAESIVENRLRELYVNNIQLSNTVLTQEEFQKDLLDNLVDALFVIDFNGEILKINKEATNLLGIDNDFKIENIAQFSNRNKKKINKLLSNFNLENDLFYYEFVNAKKEKNTLILNQKF